MANMVILQGRLTKDVDTRYTESAMCVARFTVACDRPKKKDGTKEADYVNCIAFGKTAETISNYIHKGEAIFVTGSVHTGSYTNKEGKKVYTTDIMVNGFEFPPKAKGGNSAAPAADSFVSMGEIENLAF